MKKIITAVTALIAMSVAFMSCGFTDGEVDCQTINVDLVEYSNTDLGWDSPFKMIGSDFAALKDASNPKITFVVDKDEGVDSCEVALLYGNGSFEVYDGKIYDKEGKVLSVDEEGKFTIKFESESKSSTFVIEPEAKQIEKLLDRGLAVKGAKATLSSITIEYFGKKGINTTIRNMAKADGTFKAKATDEAVGGKGEVLLDPDNANITVWTIESKGKNVDATYNFTVAADLSKLTSVVLNARTNYKYVADNLSGAVSKESAYLNDKLTITLFTDKENASSVDYNGTLSADYANIELKKADFVKTGSKGAVDFTKVAGIKISTNSNTGTLYVKSITF